MFDLNKGRSGIEELRNFLKARFVRIYPMFIFSTLFTISLVILGLIGKEALKNRYFESVPYIVMGIPNFYGLMPWNSPDLPPAFIPLWSIGVEIQFYLLIGFLIYCSMFNPKSPRIVTSLIILGLMSHVLVFRITQDMYFWTMPFTYLSLFAFGTLVSMKGTRLTHKNFLNLNALTLSILLTLIFLLTMEFDSLERYRGFGYTIFELLAMSIFYLGIRFGVGFLDNRFMYWISSRSYSIYLMHFPIRTLVRENFALDRSDFYVNLLVLVLSLVIAEITYKLVEVRFWTPKYPSSAKTFN